MLVWRTQEGSGKDQSPPPTRDGFRLGRHATPPPKNFTQKPRFRHGADSWGWTCVAVHWGWKKGPTLCFSCTCRRFGNLSSNWAAAQVCVEVVLCDGCAGSGQAEKGSVSYIYNAGGKWEGSLFRIARHAFSFL